MAQLMCPGCKATIDPGTPYCPTCFSIPVPRPDAVADPPPPQPPSLSSSVPPAVSSVGGPRACADPDCATAGIPPPDGCRACGLSAAAGATTLQFTWGAVPVKPDAPLRVGREDSPIADRLAQFSNISRKHAEIRSDGTALTVVDLGSTNGTFVNDERIPPSQPATAKEGDRIRFAATVEAKVIGGTP